MPPALVLCLALRLVYAGTQLQAKYQGLFLKMLADGFTAVQVKLQAGANVHIYPSMKGKRHAISQR